MVKAASSFRKTCSWRWCGKYTSLSMMCRGVLEIGGEFNSHSKTFDNGMICASEQSVTVLENIYKEVKENTVEDVIFSKKMKLKKKNNYHQWCIKCKD